MPQDEPLDCAIAGAGPTGLVLALELVRRGHKVRVFDRSPGPRPVHQSRALGILPPTLTLLEPSGVTERLLAEGLKLQALFATNGIRHLFGLDITKGGGRWPFLLSLPQGRTERILVARLSELGVEVEWNSQVISLGGDVRTPELVVESEAGTERVAARRVAGCDGVRSVIREELGIAFEGDASPHAFSLADGMAKDGQDSATPRVSFLPETTLIELPLPGGITRIIAPQPGVHERDDIKARFQSPIWASDFEITFAHVDDMRRGNVFLAGDAAHVHSPAGGRGMNIGIADAAWLAWSINAGREDDYEAARLPVARKVIADTRRLTNLVARTGTLRNLIVRHVMPVLLRLPGAEKRIVSRLLAHDMPHPPWIDG